MMGMGELIARIPLFTSLSEADLDDLAKSLEMRRLPKDTIFIREGEIGNEIFLLLDGYVDVIKALGDGGEQLMAHQGPGTIYGDMSLFNPQRARSATVRSTTEVLLCVLSPEDFEKLLLNRPRAALEMLRILSRRLESSDNRTILDLTAKNQALTRAYQELQAAQAQIIQKEKLEHELDLARQIQFNVLPRVLPVLNHYQVGVLMEPARAVGGDFYDIVPLPDDRLGLVVGDVSDKGIPAAFVMAMTYSVLRAEIMTNCAPDEALRMTNDQLINIGVMDMFVTALYGILDLRSGRFDYARAGHPPPIVLAADRSVLPMPRKPGQPLGIFSPTLLDVQSVTVPPGGTMLLYSDALYEAADEAGVEIGLEGGELLLAKVQHLPPDEICQQLWREVIRHSGEQQDDVTLICLKRKG